MLRLSKTFIHISLYEHLMLYKRRSAKTKKVSPFKSNKLNVGKALQKKNLKS